MGNGGSLEAAMTVEVACEATAHRCNFFHLLKILVRIPEGKMSPSVSSSLAAVRPSAEVHLDEIAARKAKYCRLAAKTAIQFAIYTL